MRTHHRIRAAIATTLAATIITGCGAWPFNKIFHGIIESGSTVTNTSLGITYTIPQGYYQDKYEATTIKEVTLRHHEKDGISHPGESPSINIALTSGPIGTSADTLVEDAEKQALSWSHDQGSVTNVRINSWDGPNLPGGEYAADWTIHSKTESCIVAVVGYPTHRVVIQASNGRPAYLPEVHDVALSAKAIPST